MPKINVYLPDDLAAAVREAGFAVSPVCQQALAEAVRSVGTARKAIEALRNPEFDPDRHPQIATRLERRMTPRVEEVIRLAREASVADGHLTTTHLLIGVLDEADNLAVRLLDGLGVDLDDLRSSALAIDVTERDGPTTGMEQSLWAGLTIPARAAIAAAIEASVELGHNYLGCEHLLLGFLDQPDGGAGRALGAAGVDKTNARRAIATALAGYGHAKQSADASTAIKVDEILRRLDAVERRLASTVT